MKTRVFFVLISMLGATLQPKPAHALPPPLFVLIYAAPGGLSSGDCSDWSIACELRYALTLASTPGYVIYVEEGRYTPTSGSDRTISFDLHSGVAIYGGFSSGAGHPRNPALYPTYLSGDLTGNDGGNFSNNAENSYHVVSAIDVDSTAVLDGLDYHRRQRRRRR